MSTSHNKANIGEIAPIVLMPGDPMRAKYIAEKFLEDVHQFNDVRCIYGYTGTYKGKRISVMASGMGMPSMGIYSYELYKKYDVDTIIRVGSSGAFTKELRLKDIVLVDSCWSQSTFAKTQSGDDSAFQYPDAKVNDVIEAASVKLNYPVTRACVYSSDVFYFEKGFEHVSEWVEKYGVTCVEMESFALFHNAKVLEKKAACLLTIADSSITHEHLSPMERQTSFDQMLSIALESTLNL